MYIIIILYRYGVGGPHGFSGGRAKGVKMSFQTLRRPEEEMNVFLFNRRHNGIDVVRYYTVYVLLMYIIHV